MRWVLVSILLGHCKQFGSGTKSIQEIPSIGFEPRISIPSSCGAIVVRCFLIEIVIFGHLHVLVGGQSFNRELRVVDPHSTRGENVQSLVNAPEEPSPGHFGRSMDKEDKVKEESDMEKCEREQEEVKVGIVVESDGVADKGTVMVKHQDTGTGDTAVLAAQRACNVTSVAEWLQEVSEISVSVFWYVTTINTHNNISSNLPAVELPFACHR